MNKQLEIVSPEIAIPVSLYGEKFGGVIGKRLHVFALGLPPDHIRHLAVETTGEITDEAIVLLDAMMITGSVRRDHVLLLVQRLSSGQISLVKVRQDGEVEWEHDLGVHINAISYPALFVSGDRIMLCWLVRGSPETLQLFTWYDGRLSPVAKLPLAASNFNVRVTPVDEDVIVTCLNGVSLTPQILRIRGGKITQQITPPGIATGSGIRILRLQKRRAAFWQDSDGQTIYWQWLDDSLKPLKPPVAIYVSQRSINDVQVYVRDDVTVLLQVLESQSTGRMVHLESPHGDRFQEAQEFLQVLFLTDGERITSTRTQKLQGSPYFAGGWIDDRLYLMHGEMQPILSVIEVI